MDHSTAYQHFLHHRLRDIILTAISTISDLLHRLPDFISPNAVILESKNACMNGPLNGHNAVVKVGFFKEKQLAKDSGG